MHLTRKDIYDFDTSVTFHSDKFKWSNSASGGWSNDNEIKPTEEDKRQFEPAADIVKGIFDKWYQWPKSTYRTFTISSSLLIQ